MYPSLLSRPSFAALLSLTALCLAGLCLAGCTSGKDLPHSSSNSRPQALQFLFVGDSTDVESGIFATTLAQHLGPKRIFLTYTENLEETPREIRSSFDGVIFYTSTVQTPPQELAGFPEETQVFPIDGRTDLDTFAQSLLNGVSKEGLAGWQLNAPEPLSYTTPPVLIPKYVNPTDPALKQNPLAPEHSVAYTQVPPNFEAQLFAAEPDIINPIAMAWDERGRLWVIETLDYPNSKYPLGEGNDSIKILEDTDADGRADKTTVFASGLSIATGFTFANDGIIVSAPPEMLFLKDTDGDDIADEQRVLFDGFLTFDTHAGVSNLRYGFDNWIWMAIGYAGFEGVIGDQEHRFKQGLFRLKPDLSSLDYLSHFSNNTWGLGFSENGDVFGSTANNEHSVYLAIPDRYFAGVNGFDKSGYSPIAPYKRFHPITDKVRQFDVFGGYTAATGHALYTARQFPQEFWNRAAFINEPTGHLVHRANLRQEGTQFVAEDSWNIMASADEWSSPVMSEVGPDGALWVLDWYNLIIQHNPVPEGFKAGDGDAYETPLRDQKHGRIYRIVHKDAKPYEPVVLREDDPAQWVNILKHDNLFWRQTAQRLLVERGEKDIVDDLLSLLDDRSVDAAGINGGAIHAIWTLHGLGAIDGSLPAVTEKIQTALTHPASGVRRAALQVLPPVPALWQAISSNNLLQDENPLVILNTLLKLSELPADQAIGRALYTLQNQPGLAEDKWLPTALAIAAARHHEGYVEALLTDASPDIQRDVTPVAIPNMTFEEREGNLPAGWRLEEYTWPIEETNPNTYTHDIVPEGRTGKALQISSPTGADVGIYMTTPVKPNTDYLFTGWIKTKDVENMGGGYGAVIDIITFGRTRTIRGTSDWTWVEKKFNTGSNTEIRIQCHLGRWGQYKGTAWFDDLRLVELGNISPAAVVAETVFRHLGAGGMAAPALSVLENLSTASSAVIDLVLSSFAENWPAGQRPANAAPDSVYQRDFASILSGKQTLQLNALLNRWAGINPETPVRPTGMKSLLLQTEVNTLKFVQDTLTIAAGQLVELTFENLDVMAHNVVIGQPGSLESIGQAADVLATSADGLAKNYVPQIANVIAATPLIDAGEKVVITFQAPTVPGEYPFICTFPGHWRVMNGILKVL
ncbi:MAG: PVC-type heme-binding CxxCH protein [Rhodothermales bacterium]